MYISDDHALPFSRLPEFGKKARAGTIQLADRAELREDFRQWCLRVPRLSSNTAKNYTYRLRQADEWLQPDSLNTASFERLQDYLFSIESTGETRNFARSAIIAFHEFLIFKGDRPRPNIAKDLPTCVRKKRMPKPITHDQAEALLYVARQDSPAALCLVVVLLTTGLRISEALSLKWSDTTSDHAYLIKKGGDQRIVFFNAQCKSTLICWRAGRKNDWVFPSPVLPDRPISRSWARNKIHDFGIAIGLPDMHPHRLRHTGATELYQETGDIVLVQKFLDHANVQSTMVYTALGDERFKSGIEQLSFKVGY